MCGKWVGGGGREGYKLLASCGIVSQIMDFPTQVQKHPNVRIDYLILVMQNKLGCYAHF